MKILTMTAAAFALAVPALAIAQPKPDDGRIFAMIDTNGDGKLDKAEVTKPNAKHKLKTLLIFSCLASK